MYCIQKVSYNFPWRKTNDPIEYYLHQTYWYLDRSDGKHNNYGTNVNPLVSWYNGKH